jgi:hypothetical protein
MLKLNAGQPTSMRGQQHGHFGFDGRSGQAGE